MLLVLVSNHIHITLIDNYTSKTYLKPWYNYAHFKAILKLFLMSYENETLEVQQILTQHCVVTSTKLTTGSVIRKQWILINCGVSVHKGMTINNLAHALTTSIHLTSRHFHVYSNLITPNYSSSAPSLVEDLLRVWYQFAFLCVNHPPARPMNRCFIIY
jgi:hypothetical protein